MAGIVAVLVDLVARHQADIVPDLVTQIGVSLGSRGILVQELFQVIIFASR